MTHSTRHTLALALTAGLAAAIACLALSPLPPETPLDLLPDKARHAAAFAALVSPCALLYPRSLTWLAPAALAFGAGIELTQPLVGRAAEVADFLADVAGVAVGLASGRVARRWLGISTAG